MKRKWMIVIGILSAISISACGGSQDTQKEKPSESRTVSELQTTVGETGTAAEETLNGINVGRYWNVGPQLRLYVPAPFLKKGENVIDILDLHEKEPKPVRGMKERNKEPGKINTKNLDNQW